MFTKNEQQAMLNAIEQAIRVNLADTFGRPIAVDAVLGDHPGEARLVLGIGKVPLRFDIEIKTTVSSSAVASLSARGTHKKLILFTPRLSAQAMAACRRLGIACADADGNLFLRSNSTVVDITGRPVGVSRKLPRAAENAARLTSRSGLQIIFSLLAAPALVDAPFRDIAKVATTSLGSVATIVKELDRAGFVSSASRGRSLRRGGDLLGIWAEGYRVRLFDRLRLGTFATDTAEWWTGAGDDVRAVGGQWGGETALWATGQNLRPARGIVYVDAVPERVLRVLRLRRDPGSDAQVEFRERFWNAPAMEENEVVPPALVYADLLADGDPRLVEAAAQFRTNNGELRRLDGS